MNSNWDEVIQINIFHSCVYSKAVLFCFVCVHVHTVFFHSDKNKLLTSFTYTSAGTVTKVTVVTQQNFFLGLWFNLCDVTD